MVEARVSVAVELTDSTIEGVAGSLERPSDRLVFPRFYMGGQTCPVPFRRLSSDSSGLPFLYLPFGSGPEWLHYRS